VEANAETRRAIGMEMRISGRGNDGNTSSAEVKKVWEGNMHRRTNEKRERANQRALVDFVLPFSFLHFISIHFVLIASPLSASIFFCVRFALGGAANPEPNP